MEDISAIAPQEREITILHPKDGSDTGIRVRIMSIDDPRMKNAQRAMIDRRQEKQARGKVLKSEEMEASLVQILAKAITGWDWGDRFGFHGEQPAYSVKTAVAVLTELPWFFEQVNTEVGDTKAFF